MLQTLPSIKYNTLTLMNIQKVSNLIKWHIDPSYSLIVTPGFPKKVITNVIIAKACLFLFKNSKAPILFLVFLQHLNKILIILYYTAKCQIMAYTSLTIIFHIFCFHEVFSHVRTFVIAILVVTLHAQK